MKLLETYLHDLNQIHSTGAAVKETSYYGPLANLLNAVGATLKPKVRCVVNIANQGAGIPDGGLFTQEQIQKGDTSSPLTGQLPARGVIEVKGTGEDVQKIVASPQVAKYWQKYRQVLVTNYRDFALVTQDANGKAETVETYRLADTEAAFWQGAANATPLASLHGSRFTEYLKRVLLHAAPLTSPSDVAWFLASYAREAKSRIEAGELPALTSLRGALEQALGMKFEGKKGEHFFRSTLVQTLFYGVFSAWVLWCKRHAPDSRERFDWRNAAWELHIPMIRALFEQIAMPSKLGPLDLVEVLDWTVTVLNRVDRAAFFEKFEEEQAVQYFYEPFLQAFDPELRKELGVWYTPPEIVRYMVARVDTALREELGVAEGLADPNVVILDPCCGTGAFLVEVLKHIHAKTGGDALAGQDVKRAAMERVFGFELLPAPFVVAHLQLGLMLQRLGAPLIAKTDERVGVYLTNALTGWEPLKEPKTHLLFPELEEERDAAARIKREGRILVIIGNPPYNGFAGVAVQEERDLSKAYRVTKAAPAPQGQGLNDLYVRFFRMAERRIVEQSGKGIVCYISNYSWLDGLSFTGMRERYLEAFSSIHIDCLHGDRIISEYAPDGRTSETIFAMQGSSAGIKIGTAIALLIATQDKAGATRLFYRDVDDARADVRRGTLLESLKHPNFDLLYTPLVPSLRIGLPFKPRKVSSNYMDWPLLPDLFPVSFPGVKTSRDDVVVSIDRERLEQRMRQYFDPKISHEQIKQSMPGVMEGTSRFDPIAIRSYLTKRGLLPDNFVRYAYRPFDMRWLYWEPETKLLDEKRSDYFLQVFEGNIWIEARQKQAMEKFDRGFVSTVLADNLGNGLSNYFPLLIRPAGQRSLLDEEDTGVPHPNLSPAARDYLNAAGAGDVPDTLFYHALAVLHAPRYREENAGALRQDWPRIPLPARHDALLASAALGRQAAVLLDAEQPVPGVTSGAIRPELQVLGRISREGGGALEPDDLALTAHWGYGGQGGVTMPGRGTVTERAYTPDEMTALGDNLALLGDTTFDVYLNPVAYWRCVPARVWHYTSGGYQVMKKWLSYREQPLLGRTLTIDEVREIMQMTRRIAALILLGSALNANYAAVQEIVHTETISV